MAGYEIRFDWEDGRDVTQPCPMCRETGPHAHDVNVYSPASPCAEAAFFRCRSCDGLFAHPFEWPDYGEDYGFPDYLRYYAEAGAGLVSMLDPLARAFRKEMRTMIDVGSGVPFAADFARRQLKLDAVCIDPSRYARQGGEWLGVPVENALLGGGSSADGQSFDIVYSSEVVEHVSDPAGFLQVLTDHLAPDGVLVLTTPNADFVSPETAALDNLGLVWPGIHHALYTAEGLKAAIERAGLCAVEVIVERERLVAFASRKAFGLNPSGTGLVEAHLEARTDDGLPDALHQGLCFRLFRDAIGRGRTDAALEALGRLRVALTRAGGPDITHSSDMAEAAEALGAEAFHETWPYFAPLTPYLSGSLALSEGCRDLTAAAEHFAAQVKICERLHGGDPLWRAEIAHLWAPALFSHGLARLMARDANSAIGSFEKLLSGDAPRGSLAAHGRRDPDLLIQARIQLGSALLQARRKPEAERVLAAVRAAADGSHHAVIDALLARCRTPT